MPSAFHEVLFPLDIALKSAGGPERRTEIVTLGSGREERNARWAHSRRRYDAGYGVRTFAALSTVVAFFEERRGRLYGFRWRDRLDHSSAAAGAPGPLDQTLGTGDGVRTAFVCDLSSGVITFLAGHVPGVDATVTAGFLFDVPVRFDTDYLEVDLTAFAAGAIPKIPLIEIKP